MTSQKQKSPNPHLVRKMPIGAEIQSGGGVHFRVWAPCRQRVSVVLEENGGASKSIELASEKNGYFSGYVPAVKAGQLYRFQLDNDSQLYPDPASRFQPEGPHGPSQIVDYSRFSWTDQDWKGVPPDGQVIYEMHIGTFTPEGTWQAAAAQLPELAGAGITVLEVMPVSDFPGSFGWGYDGVNLFAPTRLYGNPDDFRSFINQAHSLGLGVILDVVYNHIGPDGNYLLQFSKDYFTRRYKCEWGEALNFDGENCQQIREYFISNARYWIEEFHLDGLRLDATQQVFDSSNEHILSVITRAVREAGNGRSTFIVGENEPQHTRLIRPREENGYGMDALWNDDFHHSAVVAITGKNQAYYSDHLGKPQEFISAAKYGYLFQGQRYKWQKKRRGTPSFGIKPAKFVTFIENHDQIANSLRWQRIYQLTSPDLFRAMTGFFLLGPGTPMLFQWQEFGASAPFLYFADHKAELAKLVSRGRREFLEQFPNIALPEARSILDEPSSAQTFSRCKLDFSERQKNAETYSMHRDLLKIRRTDPVIKQQGALGLDGAVLGEEAFLLRYFGGAHGDRLMIVNFGRDLHLSSAPEPLLAPPEEMQWCMEWTSEDFKYGGGGTPPLETDDNWRIPGHATVLLSAKRINE